MSRERIEPEILPDASIPKKPLAGLVLIIGLAFVLRLVLALSVPVQVRSDAIEYDGYARNLLAGEGYHYVYQGRTAAWRGFHFRSYRPPGYPFFLAGVYAVFGTRPMAASLVQAILDTAVVLLVFVIARNFLAPIGALIACTAYALHVFWVPVLLTECLYTFLFTCFVWLLISDQKNPMIIRAGAGGAVLGLLVLTRPSAGIFLVPAFIYLLWKRRDRLGWMRAAVFLAVCAIVIAPWLVRTWKVHGEFVWVCNNGGRTFYDGNYLPLSPDRIIREARARGLSETQINRLFYNVTIDYLKDHPGHAIKMMFTRLYHLWMMKVPGELRFMLFRPLVAPNQPTPLRSILLYLTYILFWISKGVIVLAVIGALLFIRKRRQWLVLYLVPVILSVMHLLLFHGKPRYLAPYFPIFTVFFAASILRCKGIVINYIFTTKARRHEG